MSHKTISLLKDIPRVFKSSFFAIGEIYRGTKQQSNSWDTFQMNRLSQRNLKAIGAHLFLNSIFQKSKPNFSSNAVKRFFCESLFPQGNVFILLGQHRNSNKLGRQLVA
jgi:hypothetical protein